LTRNSKLDPEAVESGKSVTDQQNLLRSGFSFQIVETNSGAGADDLEVFIRKLSGAEPICDPLMNLLYQRVNNPLNRGLTSEDRRLERLLLAALMKQLGVSREETEIVLSHFLMQIISSIYTILRRLIAVGEAHATYRGQLRQSMTLVAPPVEHDFPRYRDCLFKKGVFLLHIQPCLRFNSTEFEQSFPKMLPHCEFDLDRGILPDAASRRARAEADRPRHCAHQCSP
jgi:hypothetical protein